LKTHTTYYSIILLSKWEKDDDRDGGIGFKSKRNLNGIDLLWSKITILPLFHTFCWLKTKMATYLPLIFQENAGMYVTDIQPCDVV